MSAIAARGAPGFDAERSAWLSCDCAAAADSGAPASSVFIASMNASAHEEMGFAFCFAFFLSDRVVFDGVGASFSGCASCSSPDGCVSIVRAVTSVTNGSPALGSSSGGTASFGGFGFGGDAAGGGVLARLIAAAIDETPPAAFSFWSAAGGFVSGVVGAVRLPARFVFGGDVDGGAIGAGVASAGLGGRRPGGGGGGVAVARLRGGGGRRHGRRRRGRRRRRRRGSGLLLRKGGGAARRPRAGSTGRPRRRPRRWP